MTLPFRQRRGRRGERRAQEHLEAAGLRLIVCNYRCRLGELDLVMDHAETVAIVEVRVRNRSDFGSATASVTAGKQRRIIAATRHLLMTRPDLARRPVRFDVIGIDGGELEWIRNAFQAMW